MAAGLPILQPGVHVEGERERALAALWGHARRELYRPKNLFTWFNLNRRFQLRFIRSGQLHVEVPTALLPDCENCVDICCTGPNAVVTLRLRDIAALVDAGFSDAIAPVASTKNTPRPGGATGWAQRSLDASVFREVFPVLKRDETGTCSLLSETRLCGAWPAWPLSCARYPYALDVEHNVLFLAKGCRSHRRMNVDDAPDSVKQLVDAALRSYNERVKDIILLHLMPQEVADIGLTAFLALPDKIARRITAPSPSPPAVGNANNLDRWEGPR